MTTRSMARWPGSASPEPGSQLRWLHSLTRFGMKLGLESMSTLLDALDRPCFERPTVLVTGTNGKGSTAAHTAAVLSAAGARTLLFTSPHLVSATERIRLDGRPLRRLSLERRLLTVRQSIRSLLRSGRLPHHPTFFEVLTAAALLQGRASRVDAAVFEIGLGGRYDATNVLPAQVSVITNIALDHMRHLGHSTRQVAWNKAGIIKPGATVLTAETAPGPLAVIKRQVSSSGGRLITVPPTAARQDAAGRWSFDLTSVSGAAGPGRWMGKPLTGIRLQMPGLFQGPNALLGMAAAAAVSAAGGPALRRSHLAAGIATAHLPGRLELRRAAGHRLIILDGAHNPAAAVSLAAALKKLLPPQSPPTLLLGVLADKDATGITRALFPLAARLFLCRPRRQRARPPRTLLKLVPPSLHPRVIDHPVRAYQAALAATPACGILLVTGSFSLLGDLAASTGRLRRAVASELQTQKSR